MRDDREVWHSTRAAANLPFPAAELVAEVSASGYHDHHIALSPDALELYVSSDRPGGAGKFDVWIARRPTRDAPFAAAVNVPALSSAGDDSLDSLSADGTTAYGNYNADLGGEADVWTSTRSCR